MNFLASKFMNSTGLDFETRHFLNKAHGILMIIAWLFFVPTAYLFIRILRTEKFGQRKILESPLWFQVHRALTVLSIVCVATSLLCIAVSSGWRWRGPGSPASFWTQSHTLLGVTSSVLCFIQGLVSLMRCNPEHRLRSLFNLVHRIIGISSFLLAVATILTAAIHFRRIWSWPTIEFILSLIPVIICLIFNILYPRRKISARTSKSVEKHGSYESLQTDSNGNPKETRFTRILRQKRVHFVFSSVGLLVIGSLILAVFVANGYKK